MQYLNDPSFERRAVGGGDDQRQRTRHPGKRFAEPNSMHEKCKQRWTTYATCSDTAQRQDGAKLQGRVRHEESFFLGEHGDPQ